MGWKTACIIANLRDDPQLATNARHDQKQANEIVNHLPGNYRFVEFSTFDYGIYARNKNLFVGAYGDAILIGDVEFALSCTAETVPPIVHVLDSLLPGANILMLTLHSVVNFYGYALFRNGHLIRARSGSADDGIIADVGNPLPEEVALFASAVANEDGEPVWFETYGGKTYEMDHASMGEEFVFSISRRVFGKRPDDFDLDVLSMSKYKRTGFSFWKRIMNR